jgi:hypothetical protein
VRRRVPETRQQQQRRASITNVVVSSIRNVIADVDVLDEVARRCAGCVRVVARVRCRCRRRRLHRRPAYWLPPSSGSISSNMRP